ncbi:hypothetical protein A1O1_05470 [Capronia coronata CBS 617.96]|uniref:Uncharacterized protein n=1 Tax=Capronia coronata CBS 617.96 TaxID=1182541 RepID=W9YFU5_9EURO|nr:uncharacterized protein A1O1_05470 [Capronia coronata CBS 617.96]EXJ88540.1 hypothetical protein A1O1_05470 [Capronia coronata CBS 617.96]
MSKPTDSWDLSDPVPSYEETIANPETVEDPISREKSTLRPSVMRQERSRRITRVLNDSIIPCFTLHLSNACNKLIIAVVPSDALRNSAPVTEQNIVAPTLSNETTVTVVLLSGDEHRSSFWTQHAVVHELDHMLRRALCGSAVPGQMRVEATNLTSQAVSAVPSQPKAMPDNPARARPPKNSWLKRTFVLPGPDHDPTGETGKWNLGWREAESPITSDGEIWSDGGTGVPSSRPGSRIRTKAPMADEIDVHTRLRDVSFRTESELGLLETTTVRCIWVEIEVGI